jgi:hypothetical protein
MSYQAIVSAMLAQGCSAEQIAAAVIALETSVEKQKQARRAADAERQRRSREQRKRGMSRDVTVTPCDLLSPKENPPTPPKEITPNHNSPSHPMRLAADFAIDEADQAFGRAEGLSDAEINRSVEDMRLWAAEAVGEKALRSDWHATARRFMRRDADAKRAGKGKPSKVVLIGKPAAPDASVYVKRDSPQGEAWWAHMKATTGRAPPTDRNGGWRFASEWPPDPSNLQILAPVENMGTAVERKYKIP